MSRFHIGHQIKQNDPLLQTLPGAESRGRVRCSECTTLPPTLQRFYQLGQTADIHPTFTWKSERWSADIRDASFLQANLTEKQHFLIPGFVFRWV